MGAVIEEGRYGGTEGEVRGGRYEGGRRRWWWKRRGEEGVVRIGGWDGLCFVMLNLIPIDYGLYILTSTLMLYLNLMVLTEGKSLTVKAHWIKEDNNIGN